MHASTLGLQAGTMTSTPFDEFYRTHHGLAVRWAIALVGSREVAEELAQDSLEAMRGRLDTLDNPAGYLRRTVVNRAASWHRWHIRERRRVARATRRRSRMCQRCHEAARFTTVRRR